jgi:4-amino-4-deoxy-L-arabinose transferase-like glycosyltransferase
MILNKKINWKFLLGLFGFILLLKLPLFFEPIGKDQGIFSYVAHQMLQGKVLYLELWDHKPPGIFYLFTLLFKIFPVSITTLRIFDLFFAFITSLVFFKLAGKFFTKENYRTYASFIFAFLFNAAWIAQGGNLTENYMVFFTIIGYLTALQYLNTKRSSLLILSGVSLSIALLFKPVALFSILGVFLLLIIQKNISKIKATINYTIGLALPQALLSFYFYLKGNLWAYIDCNYLYNTKYVSDKVSLKGLISSISSAFFEQGLSAGIFWLLALFAVYSLIIFKRKNSSSYFLIILFFAELLGICLGLRFFGHYFIQITPLLALNAVIGLTMLERKKYFNIKYLPHIIIIVITGHLLFHYLVSFNNIGTDLNTKTANYLRSKVQENEIIYVSGMETPIYFLTKTSAPTKYVHDDFLYKMSKNDQQKIMKKIFAKNPNWVVVTDPADIKHLENFGKLLQNHYTLAKDIGKYSIYKRIVTKQDVP